MAKIFASIRKGIADLLVKLLQYVFSRSLNLSTSLRVVRLLCEPAENDSSLLSDAPWVRASARCGSAVLLRSHNVAASARAHKTPKFSARAGEVESPSLLLLNSYCYPFFSYRSSRPSKAHDAHDRESMVTYI